MVYKALKVRKATPAELKAAKKRSAKKIPTAREIMQKENKIMASFLKIKNYEKLNQSAFILIVFRKVYGKVLNELKNTSDLNKFAETTKYAELIKAALFKTFLEDKPEILREQIIKVIGWLKHK